LFILNPHVTSYDQKEYLDNIKQNISLMQHVYKSKPIRCCHNYILSLNFLLSKSERAHFNNPSSRIEKYNVVFQPFSDSNSWWQL